MMTSTSLNKHDYIMQTAHFQTELKSMVFTGSVPAWLLMDYI